MTRSLHVIWIAIIVGVLAIAAAGVMRSAVPTEGISYPAQNWPQADGDLGNRRYSALSQINTETIKNLGAVWISDAFDDGAGSRVTPVVSDGVMFFTSGAKVYALDAKTGKTIWKFQTTAIPKGTPVPVAGGVGGGGGGRGITALQVSGIPNVQGPAVGEGKVFVGLSNAHMIALDQKTGQLIWDRNAAEDTTPAMSPIISAAVVYANGVIYTAITFQEARYIGRALALDAKDGHQIWRWDAIPGPGEPGHETWGQNNDYWKMGGADLWQPPTVDLDLGLVYWGTGNPSPNYVGGGVRPGNNLYSCSVVALDIKTGKLRWYYQMIHHDLWEGDLTIATILYDTEVNGVPRKGLAAMRVDGTLFFLDRATGKPIWPVEERPVRQSKLLATSPTQPFPAGRGSVIERECSKWIPIPGFIIRCDFFEPETDDPPNILNPFSSTRSMPMSYSPETGYFYVGGTDNLGWEWGSRDPATWEISSSTAMAMRVPNLQNQSNHVLAAVDPKTYKVVWKKELPYRLPGILTFAGGGWFTTAGGLAFHRMEDGNLVAFDAKTGDELWKFQAGVGLTSTANIMSYEVDGQQYIADIEEPHVMAFGLGGSLPQASAPKLPEKQDILQGPIQNSQLIRPAEATMYNYRHQISPLKDRVKAGSQVTFLNDSAMTHTFVADDGSWTTGTLLPRQKAFLTFDKPGAYLYHCKEHPWSYGLLIVAGETP